MTSAASPGAHVRQGIVDSAWADPAQVVGVVRRRSGAGLLRIAVGAGTAARAIDGRRGSAAARVERADRGAADRPHLADARHAPLGSGSDVHRMLGLLGAAGGVGDAGAIDNWASIRRCSRGRRGLGQGLSGGAALSRADVYRVLAGDRVRPMGQRGIHILGFLRSVGLICFGPRIERQPSFVLLDEWIPPTCGAGRVSATRPWPSSRGATSGHGPAALHDLVWWSGLKVADAKRGIEAAGRVAGPSSRSTASVLGVEGARRRTRTPGRSEGATSAALLPPFDESVGDRDRSARSPPNIRCSSTRERTACCGRRSFGTAGCWEPGGVDESGKKSMKLSVHLQLERFSRLSASTNGRGGAPAARMDSSSGLGGPRARFSPRPDDSGSVRRLNRAKETR